MLSKTFWTLWGIDMALRCLALDCDGVILESMAIKTNAFARLMEPYGAEARDLMVMYHSTHGGVSRHKKFEWFFQEVLGRAITPAEMDSLSRRFSELAFDEVSRCELVPGIQEVLDGWKGRLPIYVCSGAPQEELRVILKGRGLEGYFEGIYGSPPAKAELLRRIVDMAGVEPEETLMVGDSVTDLRAAEAVGTLFYGRGPEVKGDRWPWEEHLLGLNLWLERHAG